MTKPKRSRPLTTRQLLLNVQTWLDSMQEQRDRDMEERRKAHESERHALDQLRVQQENCHSWIVAIKETQTNMTEILSSLVSRVEEMHIAVTRSADETGFSTQEAEKMRELFQAFVDVNRQILRERWKWTQQHAPTLARAEALIRQADMYS